MSENIKTIEAQRLKIKQLEEENEELLSALKELYLCSSTPFTEEQENRKLKARFNAEDIINKYTK